MKAAETTARRLQGGPQIWRLGREPAPSGPHVTLIPGAHAPLLPVNLPEKLVGIARERVAERQLQENLSVTSGSIEMRPFLPKGIRQFQSALVVETGLAESWRKELRPGCLAVLPDYLALPVAPGLWAVEVVDDSVVVRLGPEDGFAAEAQLALALLTVAPAPKAVLRSGDAQAAIDGFLAGFGVPVLDDAAKLKKAGFTPMRWADAAGGIDLKEPPSVAFDRLRTRILRWRTPAIFAVLAISAWLGSLAYETRTLRTDAALNKQRTLDLVQQYFVPSGPILDVRAQVSAAAESLRTPKMIEIDTVPPLVQFQIAAPFLTADTLRLVAVSYRDDTGLVTAIEAADFAVLDQMIADLQDSGFLVEQLDSRAQQAGGVVARLRVELLQ